MNKFRGIESILKEGQKKEKAIKVPGTVQQVVPFARAWHDILMLKDGRYRKTYRFDDINYTGMDQNVQERIVNDYQSFLNSFREEWTFKITINNRVLTESEVEKEITLPELSDDLGKICSDYNALQRERSGRNKISKEMYVTCTFDAAEIEEARSIADMVEAELAAALEVLNSRLVPLDTVEVLKIIRDWFRPGEESDIEIDFEADRKLGKSFIDAFVPHAMRNDIRSQCIVIDEKYYMRALCIEDFGTYLLDTVLTDVITKNKIMMLSIDSITVDKDVALDFGEVKLSNLNGKGKKYVQKSRKNNIYVDDYPYQVQRGIESVKEFLADLDKRDKEMFLTSFTIIHMADSLEELNNDSEEIIKSLKNDHARASIMWWQQLDGLVTALPVGVNRNQVFRTMTSESLAACMVFNSVEIQHPSGNIVGVNKRSKKLITVDEHELMNQNCFVLGVPGSGKSVFAKLTRILEPTLRNPNINVIVIDPQGEYAPLISALNGQIIDVSASGDCHINVMDIADDYGSDEDGPIIVKTEFVLSLYETIAGRVASAKEKSILSRCVEALYDNQDSVTLCDLHDLLLDQPEETAADIALDLELFTVGQLNSFSQKTNVELDNRIICFDIHRMSEQLRPVAMLVVMDYIDNTLANNKESKTETHVVCDEFDIIHNHEYSALKMDGLWRRVRKAGGFCTAITQNSASVRESNVASKMFSNSEYIVVFKQKAEDCANLEQLISLQQEDLKFVQRCQTGEGVLIVGTNSIRFDASIPTDNNIYKLVSTKFVEK